MASPLKPIYSILVVSPPKFSGKCSVIFATLWNLEYLIKTINKLHISVWWHKKTKRKQSTRACNYWYDNMLIPNIVSYYHIEKVLYTCIMVFLCISNSLSRKEVCKQEQCNGITEMRNG